jgi:crossover junction endodeoxyribonuclease RuvC
MRILGIDPGLGRMGWGVIEEDKSVIKGIAFDCIETPTKISDEKRLLLIYHELTRIVTLYQPEVMAIEQLFFSRNVTTAFMVGQARGVALLVAAQAGLEVITYAPSEVKLAVAGYGGADKKQLGQMVKAILRLKTLPKLDDTIDALAIAITHGFSGKLARKLQ